MSLCYLLIYLIDGDLKFLQQDVDDAMIKESRPPPAEASGSGGASNPEAGKFKEDEFVRLRRAKNALRPE